MAGRSSSIQILRDSASGDGNSGAGTRKLPHVSPTAGRDVGHPASTPGNGKAKRKIPRLARKASLSRNDAYEIYTSNLSLGITLLMQGW